MKSKWFLLLCVLLISFPVAAQVPRKTESIFERQNLVAWCIVPFDKMKRDPRQRADMLKDLGITQLAWDWRTEHLPFMEEEISALRKNNIKLKAVWFWVNGKADGSLDDENYFILETLKKNQVKTELWVSFNDNFFGELTDEEKLNKAVKTIGDIHDKASAIGCTVHLYNHGSWFGEPANQVNIIESTGRKDIGIIYNFHHARHQVNEFPKLLELMKPYLTTVNINGMREDGPMILPVGQGDKELEMLVQLKSSGFSGSIGILSHVDDEDAKIVLDRNIRGLKELLKKMNDKKALSTYP